VWYRLARSVRHELKLLEVLVSADRANLPIR
jgi:hypothetical protein